MAATIRSFLFLIDFRVAVCNYNPVGRKRVRVIVIYRQRISGLCELLNYTHLSRVGDLMCNNTVRSAHDINIVNINSFNATNHRASAFTSILIVCDVDSPLRFLTVTFSQSALTEFH